MAERIRIREVRFHKFVGEFPEVPTYPHVDTAMLYEGDDNPFHVTLPIAEVGRVSSNGLLYDEELVSAIAEQMKEGMGGIRGHLKDEEIDTSFPIDEVNWIGSALVDGVLWSKGYVPISPTREDLRRKKATGGGVGTSIFGDAIKETLDVPVNGRKAWRAKNFKLEQLDLAPARRAALQMGGAFAVTREMAEENDMPEITSIADVPQAIREQIIAQAQGNASAERVKELEQQVQTLGSANTERVRELEQQLQTHETTIAELKKNATVVAEIYTVLGPDADVVSIVRQMHTAMTELANQLGVVFADISVRVSEMHEQVVEMRQTAFDRVVDDHIAELTNWTARDEAGKQRVTSFRKTLRRATLSELGDKRDEKVVAETVKKLWDEEFEVLGEAVVKELAGPGAVVTQTRQKPTGSNGLNLEEGWEDRILEEFGVGSTKS